jgi:hypothetical protein
MRRWVCIDERAQKRTKWHSRDPLRITEVNRRRREDEKRE